MASRLAALVREREASSRTISYVERKLTENLLSPLTTVKISQHLESVAKIQDKTEENFQKIVNLCDPADCDSYAADYEALMDRILEVRCNLTSLNNSLQPKLQTALQRPVPVNNDIRLPRLTLPIFEGRLEEWSSFRDMFITTIDNNPNLSPAQKLTYLKAQLKGEASRQVQSLSICDANYEIAIQQLVNRYQNDRQLLFAVLKRMVNQPSISTASSVSLRQLVDVTRESLRSMETLNQPVQSWDSIVLFLIYQKLDAGTRELYEQSLHSSKIASLDEFFEFIEQRSRALEAAGVRNSFNVRPAERIKSVVQKSSVHHAQQSVYNCKVCEQTHPIYKCAKFLSMDISSRREVVRKFSLCFNCLRSGHVSLKCESHSNCKKCGGKHNTLLHVVPAAHEVTEKTVSTVPQLNHHANIGHTQTLLATAVVSMRDCIGNNQKVRVFLDGGSETHIITTNCMRKLGIKWKKQHASVTGLSSMPVGQSVGVVDLQFTPHFDHSHSIPANQVYVMDKITSQLPNKCCDQNQPHMYGLELADQNWHIPADVDMLLGASLAYSLIRGEKIHGNPGQPFAQSSDLGWLVVGSVSAINNCNLSTYHSSTSHENDQAPVVAASDVNLDNTLRSFWEVEEIHCKPECLTTEEKQCENHFTSTHRKLPDGRFEVQLPFKTHPSKLGSSLGMAIQRLKQLERRFVRHPEKREAYITFMREYVKSNHMELVPADEVIPNQLYYIPHHYVCKEDSTTTKLRVVFDASCNTTNGKSLNDCMMVGPTIQKTLLSILMKFRTYLIAFTADIKQMYRQVRVAQPDCEFQRILWREDSNEPIQHYRLLTVTYGTAAAPFLATRTLQQLAMNEVESLPTAANTVLNDFYVDDCMSGAADLEQAKKLQTEIMELMKRGRLELRKWSSNSSELVEALPVEFRETKSVLEVDTGQTVKTLGIYWQPEKDIFFFRINNIEICNVTLTKRHILSQIAKIFDPIGWLSPVIITAKIMMQSLWKLNVGWDEPLCGTITTQWIKYRQELKYIEDVAIPRCVLTNSSAELCLVGFGDASEQAYAAVIYLCAYSLDSTQISLIASKTRVAPSKPTTIPRLELNAALLVAELMMAVKNSLQLDNPRIAAYSDSTVTLAWIRSHPTRWQTYVANRVARIQECIPAECWSHVAGVDNPADCASRGIPSSQLVDHPLWWTGPHWLQKKQLPKDMPVDHEAEAAIEKEEKRSVKCAATRINHSMSPEKFSSLLRLQRISAWSFRFITNVVLKIRKSKSTFLCSDEEGMSGEVLRIGLLLGSSCGLSAGRQQPLQSGPLTVDELQFACDYWLKQTQGQWFPREIQCLKLKQELPKSSEIIRLNPFLDKNDMLRVGGRIQNSDLHYNQKHPLLLPSKAYFTKLIIIHYHDKLFHAGAQLLCATLSSKYWITRCRDVVRFQLRKCVRCCKMRADLQCQFMGDLPRARVTPSRVFSKVGVDYAGPFILKPMLSRSKTSIKCYISLFVCFATKAIHLELVSSLSTEAFIAALRRFIARRGKPTEIHSDCGTNFIGANRELKELVKYISSQKHNDDITNDLSSDNIQWKFNPPGAPHFGGLWEAGVKSVKYHLRRVMGTNRFNFEELSTITTQIEAILNSRPLTPLSDDPTELAALTAGHFIIGAPMTSAPDPDVTEKPINRLGRWQLLQNIYQSFWRRWSKEYLTRMQQRPKWMAVKRQMEIGDMVTIRDENLAPLHWKLGRVQEIHPGADNIVRVVTLQTVNGVMKRPVTKLCLLPISNDDIL